MSAGLVVSNLSAGYGDVSVLADVSLSAEVGLITAVIGSNGAGKTTLLRSLSGLLKPRQGSIRIGEAELSGAKALDFVNAGIAHVPEGRRLFAGMTVEDNLLMGAFARAAAPAELRQDIDRIYAMFPKLAERRRQDAVSMSGGEQQMCAIGRALMSNPKLLLLDEPSAGLAPVVVQQVFELVKRIRASGLTVLIVEQNVQQVLRVVDRAYLLEAGSIRAAGTAAELAASDTIKQAYLGV